MSDLTVAPSSRSTPLPWLIAGAWLALVASIAASGWFLDPDAAIPVRILPFAALPPLLFLLAYRLLPGVRAWVAGLDLAVVVGLQAWRVVGLVFLAYWATGGLPAAFAVPAGLGDLAVAALAIGVTVAVARRSSGWETGVRALVVWGLVDFAVAFGTAILSGEGMPLRLDGAPLPAMVLTLPLALIPAFGVPAFTILHLIAWLRLPPRG